MNEACWNRYKLPLLGLLLLSPSAAYAASTDVESQGASRSMALTLFSLASYPGAEDCPEGLNPSPTEIYLQRYIPADQKAFLSRPENNRRLRYTAAGLPGRKNICQDPELALELRANYPLNHLVEGEVAFGLNLDGGTGPEDVAPGIKPHENFTSPQGEPGIDNETYRVLGCASTVRSSAPPGSSFDEVFKDDTREIRNGEYSILVEIRGIDDVRNDERVEVGLYSGRDAMVQNQQGRLIAYTSQTIHSDTKWHNELGGRIVDGVLVTEPADVRLKWQSGPVRGSWYVRGARLRLELTDDGGARGLMGGYMDIESFYRPLANGYRIFLATDGSVDCPAWYKTLYEYADGYPDPQTGKHTAISAAWALRAVPAFLFAPEPPDAPASDTIAGAGEKSRGVAQDGR